MKREGDFLGHSDISYSGENITYLLSVGVDIDNDDFKMYMPHLSFIEDYGGRDERYICESWDSEEYLIETLYENVLTNWVCNRKIDNPLEFAGLLNVEGVSLNDFQGLMELFEIAIKLKFFNKYYSDKLIKEKQL